MSAEVTKLGFIRTGTSGNTQVKFTGKTITFTEETPTSEMKSLEIEIQSGDNQDFRLTIPIYGVTVAAIDAMIEQLKVAREFMIKVRE